MVFDVHGGFGAVSEAADGAKALEVLKTGSFDVVITDFSMPGASGLEVIDATLSGSPSTVVVTVSATADVGQDALRRGASAFFDKWESTTDLLPRFVTAVLAEHEALRPSSRHLRCPACRRRASRDRYVCGGSKQPTSETCRACQPTSGADNGNWRGGKTYHKAGYVMRRTPGHPRARAKSPYVFEHVLVMEEKLGRYLLEDESVHHVNGVKDDNRIENLELWVRPQPSGIRASDAVSWAKEILARYEGGSGSSNNAQAEVD
jgi:CheY-like chemotaxis protein